MLTIWGRANSINVQKVLWCCEELGLPFKRTDAGNEFGVVDSSSYRSLNPNGLVPTIEDDGFHLWESNVIVRYLAHKDTERKLCPRDLRTRFDAERWMDRQATVFWPALRPLFIQFIRTPAEKRDQAAITRAQQLSLAAVNILDGQLSGRSYLAGHHFTMGDIPAAVAIHRWYELDTPHPELPHVRRWYGLMRQRECFQKIVMIPLS